MTTVQDKKDLVKWARQGKLEGDTGVRQKLTELLKSGCTAEDLDFNDNKFERSALWEATWKNHEGIVRLLSEKGASIAKPDANARTPLHEAAFFGHMNLVQFFLEKGHPIDPLDKWGHTPLFRAVEAGRHDIVQCLLERKAEQNLLDNAGITTQHVASFYGMPHASDWLMYRGAWKNRYGIDDGGAVLDAEEPAAAEEPENPSGPPAGAPEAVAEGGAAAAAAGGGGSKPAAGGRPKYGD
eukprot:TRINITY_DN105797_c0_g1_i1.p1 TRINITY_DN105797_c0_g1~~TRINITY_DN105797_c0_g1_i1.p1  ORF type:complete len:240 (-),score=68.20 TRINITY_DN105797_c0_g1_i1:243-962(-)